MNPAHLHLVLNHFPVVGTVAAAALLTLALLLGRAVLFRAGLWALIASAVLVVPVYLSGEGAEDVAEELGAAEALVEAHEEAALVVLVALLLVGAVAVALLWILRRREELSRKPMALAWALSLGAVALTAWTANRGGQIRHPEIRGELFDVPAEMRQELRDRVEEARSRVERAREELRQAEERAREKAREAGEEARGRVEEAREKVDRAREELERARQELRRLEEAGEGAAEALEEP